VLECSSARVRKLDARAIDEEHGRPLGFISEGSEPAKSMNNFDVHPRHAMPIGLDGLAQLSAKG
jgi:hypothetical protein